MTILDALIMYLIFVIVLVPMAWVFEVAQSMTQTITCRCGRQRSRNVICPEVDVSSLQDAMTANCPWCQSQNERSESDVCAESNLSTL